MEKLKRFERHLQAADASDLVCDDELVLCFEQRQKARQRARLESGAEIGIQLDRGTILRGGDMLEGQDGLLVRVTAAPEPVSVASSDDALLLARAAYHLGNRHVHLQVAPGSVRYLSDHVLDDMIRSLGLLVTHAELPFEPEAGAYARGHVHTHGANGHDHENSHAQGVNHEH